MPAGTKNPSSKMNFTAIILAIIKQVTKSAAMTTNQNDTFKPDSFCAGMKRHLAGDKLETNRVLQPCLGESMQAQQTTITATTCQCFSLVAAPGKLVGYFEFNPFADDLSLIQAEQRSMETEYSSILNSGFGSQVCHAFVSGQVFGSAIRIATVVDGIDAKENIVGSSHFCISQSE